MSCWVAPSIAAELWGMPLQSILDGIRTGQIPSKTDLGFTLVQADRNAAPATTPIATPMPTFSMVHVAQPKHQAAVPVEEEEPQTISISTEHDEDAEFDWRQVRRLVQQTRRRPLAAAA